MLAQMGQEVQQDLGGGPPDHFLVGAPVIDPGGAAPVVVNPGAPTLAPVKAFQANESNLIGPVELKRSGRLVKSECSCCASHSASLK